MKKRFNKKWQTYALVNKVCELQQKVDYYERFLQEVGTMCWTGRLLYILEDKYSSGDTGRIYQFIKKKIEEENAKN